jgi:hypothetical protein
VEKSRDGTVFFKAAMRPIICFHSISKLRTSDPSGASRAPFSPVLGNLCNLPFVSAAFISFGLFGHIGSTSLHQQLSEVTTNVSLVSPMFSLILGYPFMRSHTFLSQSMVKPSII